MKLLATKKGKIICCTAVIALLIAVGIVFTVVFGKKEYRSISVEAVQGSVTVVNEKTNDQAYKGQRLYGGDDVTVRENSELTMCMNNDKYLYADENTHFRLEDHSTKNSSRIRVILDKGSELNELTEKLNADESYDVDTPNATMSVRGTKFRVTVFTDADGMVYTLLEVEEGVVSVQLKTVSGTYNGVEKEFHAGESALIRADRDFSEFVRSEEGKEIYRLDYSLLPKDHILRLKELLRNAVSNDGNDPDEKDDKEPSDDPDKGNITGDDPDKDNKPGDDPDKDNKPGDGNDPEPDDPSAEHTHTQGDFEITLEPGCETKGEKTAVCTECGEPMATEEISPLGHDYTEWTSVKKATCLEEGTESRACLRCGQTENRVLKPTGHSFGAWETVKAPSCGSEGTEERKCSVCNAKESRSVPATGNHKWGNYKEDRLPGCITEGEGHYTCTVCGAEGSHETIPAKGHVYSAWTTEKAANCKVQGLESRKCSVCGNTETRSVPATGKHDFAAFTEDVPAECMKDGEGHYVCTVCGDKGSTVTIPATGHDYQEISRESISEEKVKVTYRCSYCGSEYSATKMK